jgi:hypothetical protein
MTRAVLVLVAVLTITRVTFAQQQLPPPRKLAGDEFIAQPQGPALVPPQNAAQQAAQNAPQQPAQNPQQQQPAVAAPVGAQDVKRTPAEWRALFAARRRAEDDRQQARIARMNQFKAARAAEDAKLYQDWHERYLADAPVRVEYYRALAAAYQSPASIPYYGTPYYYAAGPPVILPVVYAPVIYTPVSRPYTYGTFFSWGW